MRRAEALARGGRTLLLACLLGWWASLCGAHPMPESRVWIDTTPTGLLLTLQWPLNRLEYAFGQPLADEPDAVMARHEQALVQYVLQHVGARSGDLGWQAARPRLEVVGHDASAELHAVVELKAPPGADIRSPTLICDAIIHEVRTHRAQVFLRSDWAGGFVGQPPLLLGELTPGHATLPLSLSAPSAGASAMALFKEGAWHIAEGTDHLLFLLLLVIVAPAMAVGRRWRVPRQDGRAVRQLVWVATAFTIGHSITLALGSTGVLTPPSQPVEVAVAITIVVAAIHAWRPLLLNGEVAMALGFGLVHGLAFSASLSGAGLTPWQHAQALLAFNLGIEAIQLALLMTVAPALLALSRAWPAGYNALRITVAAAGGLLAMVWVLQRSGVPLPGGG